MLVLHKLQMWCRQTQQLQNNVRLRAQSFQVLQVNFKMQLASISFLQEKVESRIFLLHLLMIAIILTMKVLSHWILTSVNIKDKIGLLFPTPAAKCRGSVS